MDPTASPPVTPVLAEGTLPELGVGSWVRLSSGEIGCVEVKTPGGWGVILRDGTRTLTGTGTQVLTPPLRPGSEVLVDREKVRVEYLDSQGGVHYRRPQGREGVAHVLHLHPIPAVGSLVTLGSGSWRYRVESVSWGSEPMADLVCVDELEIQRTSRLVQLWPALPETVPVPEKNPPDSKGTKPETPTSPPSPLTLGAVVRVPCQRGLMGMVTRRIGHYFRVVLFAGQGTLCLFSTELELVAEGFQVGSRVFEVGGGDDFIVRGIDPEKGKILLSNGVDRDAIELRPFPRAGDSILVLEQGVPHTHTVLRVEGNHLIYMRPDAHGVPREQCVAVGQAARLYPTPPPNPPEPPRTPPVIYGPGLGATVRTPSGVGMVVGALAPRLQVRLADRGTVVEPSLTQCEVLEEAWKPGDKLLYRDRLAEVVEIDNDRVRLVYPGSKPRPWVPALECRRVVPVGAEVFPRTHPSHRFRVEKLDLDQGIAIVTSIPTARVTRFSIEELVRVWGEEPLRVGTVVRVPGGGTGVICAEHPDGVRVVRLETDSAGAPLDSSLEFSGPARELQPLQVPRLAPRTPMTVRTPGTPVLVDSPGSLYHGYRGEVFDLQEDPPRYRVRLLRTPSDLPCHREMFLGPEELTQSSPVPCFAQRTRVRIVGPNLPGHGRTGTVSCYRVQTGDYRVWLDSENGWQDYVHCKGAELEEVVMEKEIPLWSTVEMRNPASVLYKGRATVTDNSEPGYYRVFSREFSDAREFRLPAHDVRLVPDVTPHPLLGAQVLVRNQNLEEFGRRGTVYGLEKTESGTEYHVLLNPETAKPSDSRVFSSFWRDELNVVSSPLFPPGVVRHARVQIVAPGHAHHGCEGIILSLDPEKGKIQVRILKDRAGNSCEGAWGDSNHLVTQVRPIPATAKGTTAVNEPREESPMTTPNTPNNPPSAPPNPPTLVELGVEVAKEGAKTAGKRVAVRQVRRKLRQLTAGALAKKVSARRGGTPNQKRILELRNAAAEFLETREGDALFALFLAGAWPVARLYIKNERALQVGDRIAMEMFTQGVEGVEVVVEPVVDVITAFLVDQGAKALEMFDDGEDARVLGARTTPTTTPASVAVNFAEPSR